MDKYKRAYRMRGAIPRDLDVIAKLPDVDDDGYIIYPELRAVALAVCSPGRSGPRFLVRYPNGAVTATSYFNLFPPLERLWYGNLQPPARRRALRRWRTRLRASLPSSGDWCQGNWYVSVEELASRIGLSGDGLIEAVVQGRLMLDGQQLDCTGGYVPLGARLTCLPPPRP